MDEPKKKKEPKENKRILIPRFLNFIYYAIATIHVKLHYKVKADRKVLRKQKRGSIIIYNHASGKDQFFVKAGVGIKRVNYVMARYFFFNKLVAFLLNWAKVVSKDQLRPDIVAIRKMKEIIDHKGHVMIAPAGQTMIDGTTPFIPKSLVKLIKICDCDVLCMQMRGVYLNYPKWDTKGSKRKCKNISYKFVKVLEKEELETLSNDEIYERILDSVNIPEYELQKTDPWEIKGLELTHGLDNLLVKCPKCGAMHSFKSLGNQLVCDKCNVFIKMNNYGLLEFSDKYGINFDNIHDWYLWQEEKIFNDYELTHHLEMSGTMYTNIKKENKLEESGNGKLVLGDNEFYYFGTINGEEKRVNFNLKIISQLPFDCGVRIDIPDMDHSYRFFPNNPKLMIDFVQVINHMTMLNNK